MSSETFTDFSSNSLYFRAQASLQLRFCNDFFKSQAYRMQVLSQNCQQQNEIDQNIDEKL